MAAGCFPANPAHDRMVHLWLFAVAALVFAIVVVGGATRLTDSGLSITEWRPVTGVLPPLNAAEWMVEFEKYRQIDQYQAINKGMSLEAFKVIFWWEWGHRLLGRLIGAAMLAPWLVFAVTGVLRGRLLWTTFGIGALIGLQGLVGWLMVASGLQPGMTSVAPLKLMFHLTLACAIFAALIWTAMGVGPRRARDPLPAAVVFGGVAALVLVFAQVMLGALVAGNDAGMRFNDWPLMDGALVPPAAVLFDKPSAIQSLVGSLALTQFNHRIGAYALLALAFWHWRRARGAWAERGALILLILIAAQAAIGVVTLWLVVPLWAGLLHQGFAVVVIGHAVAHVFALVHALRPAGAGAGVAPLPAQR